MEVNITVNITMKADRLMDLYPKPAQRFSRNSEKFTKLKGEGRR